jgi:hypothetical protein
MTPARRKACVDAIRAGATLKAAAGAAGITYEALRQWRLNDPTFDAELDAAEGKLIAELTSVVVNAATGRVGDVKRALGKLGVRKGVGDPDLALKLLSARWPEGWGRRRVELTGVDGGPVELEAVDYRDKLRARVTELAERRARRAIESAE